MFPLVQSVVSLRGVGKGWLNGERGWATTHRICPFASLARAESKAAKIDLPRASRSPSTLLSMSRMGSICVKECAVRVFLFPVPDGGSQEPLCQVLWHLRRFPDFQNT